MKAVVMCRDIHDYEGDIMERPEAYRRAQKRVEARFGFYIHLAVYLVVGIVLMVVNFSTSTEYLWFKWPLFGWGIGVVFHALSVFVFSGTSPITEQMIEKEMEKER